MDLVSASVVMADNAPTLRFTLNPDSVECLRRHNLTIEEGIVLLSIYLGRVALVTDYMSTRISDDRKVVYFQPLLRKQFLSQKEVPADGFDISWYHLTEYANKVCMELLELMGEVSDVSREILSEELLGAIKSRISNTEISEFDSFVTQFIELFPDKTRNGGNKLLRSNFDDVKAKLIKFFNKYKKYDKDIVLQATRSYLGNFRGEYTYCPASEFFISKNSVSQLATECDMCIKQNIGRKEEGTEYIPSNPFENLM